MTGKESAPSGPNPFPRIYAADNAFKVSTAENMRAAEKRNVLIRVANAVPSRQRECAPPILTAMLPIRFRTFLTGLAVLTLAAAAVAGQGKKRRLDDAPVAPPTPATPPAEEPAQPAAPAAPPSPWHVWSDGGGRKIEAEYRGLDGNLVLVRARDGSSYRLDLAKLVPADGEFARLMQKTLPPPPVPIATAAAKIDALVLAGLTKAGQQPNAPASDEQLVRRLYLDIVGRIPTAAETAAFVDSKASDKRPKLIDQLLTSEGYNSQMFNWLADMLRITDDYGRGVKTYVYEEWIKDQIAENRPWDGFVHDLMTAEGRLSNSGPVGYLLRDRNMPLDNLSNTVTTFLGANVACAQCHNHPLAPWTQREFFELASFFGATDATAVKANGQAKRLAKKTDVDQKVLIKIMAPNLADVDGLHKNTMTFPKDYKYPDAKPGTAVPPKFIEWAQDETKNTTAPPVPQKPEELRKAFADWLTRKDNPRFATAIANRLWQRVFGLAVQEPVTDLDDLSKGSNPPLLAHLTEEMKRVNFDIREFQRIVFNTQAYQRQASITPDLGKGPYLFPGPLLRRMTAEQAWDSVLTLVVGPELDKFKLRRADEITRMNIPGPVNQESILAKAKEIIEGDGTTGGKKGVSGKGGGKKRMGGVNAEDYDGVPPPRFENLTLARASELPQPAKEAHFLRAFGQSDRQIADTESREGSVPQVLTMMNGEIQRCIASAQSMVLKDAAKQKTPELQVESLYFSFLGRRPTIMETQTARRVFGEGLKLPDLTWVLFNSREFIFIQ